MDTQLEIKTKEDFRMLLDANDRVISVMLAKQGFYDGFGTQVVRDNLKKGDTFIDVGAHIGWFTLLAAKLVGEKGKVYAFEPDPVNFAILEANVALNNFKNVQLEQKAVISKKKKMLLYLSNRNTGDHRLYSTKTKAEPMRANIEVQGISLDKYFEDDLPKVNLMKVDTQGAEAAVLRGAQKLIKSRKKLKMFIEFWPFGLVHMGDDPQEFLKALVKLKFKIYLANRETHIVTAVKLGRLLQVFTPENARFANLLCVKGE